MTGRMGFWGLVRSMQPTSPALAPFMVHHQLLPVLDTRDTKGRHLVTLERHHCSIPGVWHPSWEAQTGSARMQCTHGDRKEDRKDSGDMRIWRREWQTRCCSCFVCVHSCAEQWWTYQPED